MSETTDIKARVREILIVYYGWHGKTIVEATRLADEKMEELKQQILKEATQ